MKLLLVLLLSSATWIYPVKVAGAYPPQETVTFQNYEQIRRDNKESKTSETIRPKSNKVSESRPRVDNSPTYSGRNYTKEEVQQLIKGYSAQYGINSNAPLCVASKESGFNQFSKNKSSTASGVFQYLSGTWKSTDEGKAGYSVFDADANVKAAIKYMASRLNTKPWVVGTSCPPVTKIK